jgi:hypothetical protein
VTGQNLHKMPTAPQRLTGLRRVMVLWPLCLLILLTACGHGNPAKTCRVEMPTGLTTCASPKPFPVAAAASQADVADALVDIYAAWEDCSRKLWGVVGIVNAANANP